MKMCLVVDDSDVVRRVARRIAEELNFVPLEADGGEAALEQCRNDLPDAILLDWQMPSMNGIDFLTALNELPDGDKPKVFYCTTEHDPANITRALNAGACDYMLKPYDYNLVEEKFRTAGLM
ncbi:MAG: response regulator [Hyphomicrobiaceae bacterium]